MSFVISQTQTTKTSEELEKEYQDALKALQEKGDKFSYYGDFLKLDPVNQAKIITNNLNKLLPSLRSFSSDERNNLFKKYSRELEAAFSSSAIDPLVKVELYIGKDNKGQVLMKEDLKDKLFNPFLDAFKKLETAKKAELFYDKDKNSNPLIDSNYKNKIWQRLETAEQNSLLKGIINRAFKKLYFPFESTGKLPELKDVSIDASQVSSLKWQGNKLIGENGGYINFERDKNKLYDDSIDSRVIGIRYSGDKFKLDYISGRSIIFSEGSMNFDGRVIGKDGKIIGGKRELNLLYTKEGKPSAEGKNRIIEISYNQNGDAVFKLDGNDYENNFLRIKDVHGNSIMIGVNMHNLDKGNLADKHKPIVRVDKDGIIWVKAGEVKTTGYGTYKVSNNQEIALLGNYFNEPGAGIRDVMSRVQERISPKLREEIKEQFKSELKKGIDNLLQIEQSTGEKPGISDVVADALGKTYGYMWGEISKTKKGETQMFTESLQEISNPLYSQFAKEGKSYINIDVFKNEVKSTMGGKELTVPWVGVSIGSKGYVGADLISFYKNIDVLSVNSQGKKGENVYVADGASLFSFIGDKTYFNSRPINSETYLYGARTKIPIERIYNEQSQSKPWKLDNDRYGRFNLYTVDATTPRSFTKGNQYITLPFGGIIYGGGMQIENPPIDPEAYPGDSKNTQIDIVVVGERIPGTGIGRPGGIIDRKISQKASSSSMPTNHVANMMSGSVILTFNKFINQMGYEKVDNFMRLVDKISNTPGVDPYQVIPGYDNSLMDYSYIWTHPDKVDSTMASLSSAGQIVRGTSVTLTMDRGMYYGGSRIQGTDPTVTRTVASAIVRAPLPSSYMDHREAQAKQGEMSATKRVYSLQNYLIAVKNGDKKSVDQTLYRIKSDLPNVNF